MISIILPVYNEEFYLGKNVPLILRAAEKISECEILIVEESTDRTPQIAESLSRKYKNVRHFHFTKRLGKGKAIEAGIEHARGGKIIFMDIDLSVDLSALEKLVTMLDSYDIVVGSRYHKASQTKRTLLRLIMGRGYGLLSKITLGVNVNDFQCGFKGLRKNAAKTIIHRTSAKGVFWDTEMLFLAKKFGFSIQEIPIKWVEKKTRSTKIGISTIYNFSLQISKLLLSSILRAGPFRAR